MTAAACGQSLSSPRELKPPTIQDFAEIAQLVSDLDALVAEGLVERITDQHGIERFRPVREAEAAA